MFTKCRACDRQPEDCALKFLLIPFPEFVAWLNKFKKDHGLSNIKFSGKCSTPAGTIGRITSGDEDDCRFSTFQDLAITALEIVRAEFPCPEFVPTVQHLELLAQQAEKLQLVEKENAELRAQLAEQEIRHRNDIRAICAEYQAQLADKSEQIAGHKANEMFLKEQLRAAQAR